MSYTFTVTTWYIEHFDHEGLHQLVTKEMGDVIGFIQLTNIFIIITSTVLFTKYFTVQHKQYFSYIVRPSLKRNAQELSSFGSLFLSVFQECTISLLVNIWQTCLLHRVLPGSATSLLFSLEG